MCTTSVFIIELFMTWFYKSGFFSIFEMFYGCGISEFRTGKILLLTTHLSLLSWVGSGESTRHIYLARRASGRKYEPK